MSTKIISDEQMRRVLAEHRCDSGYGTYRTSSLASVGKIGLFMWEGTHCKYCGEKLPQTVNEMGPGMGITGGT